MSIDITYVKVQQNPIFARVNWIAQGGAMALPLATSLSRSFLFGNIITNQLSHSRLNGLFILSSYLR